jgi:hypothetical protein
MSVIGSFCTPQINKELLSELRIRRPLLNKCVVAIVLAFQINIWDRLYKIVAKVYYG